MNINFSPVPSDPRFPSLSSSQIPPHLPTHPTPHLRFSLSHPILSHPTVWPDQLLIIPPNKPTVSCYLRVLAASHGSLLPLLTSTGQSLAFLMLLEHLMCSRLSWDPSGDTGLLSSPLLPDQAALKGREGIRSVFISHYPTHNY